MYKFRGVMYYTIRIFVVIPNMCDVSVHGMMVTFTGLLCVLTLHVQHL